MKMSAIGSVSGHPLIVRQCPLMTHSGHHACVLAARSGASRPLPERKQERPRLSATKLKRPRAKWLRPRRRSGSLPDDVRKIVRREINRQLRDFRRIGHPLAGIVGCKDALDGVALLFACEATEHRRVRRAWA